ncbi:hypothetical protein RHCRD62_60277 [Rhodococcus sp. RD6.2]|nr:hypothetical protein RHCRD62_60277 [Rhodococcus sp. RD6.2]
MYHTRSRLPRRRLRRSRPDRPRSRTHRGAGEALRHPARGDLTVRGDGVDADRRRHRCHSPAHPCRPGDRSGRSRPARGLREAVRRGPVAGAHDARRGGSSRCRAPGGNRVPLRDASGIAGAGGCRGLDRYPQAGHVPPPPADVRRGRRRGARLVDRRRLRRWLAGRAGNSHDRPDPLHAGRIRYGQRRTTCGGRPRPDSRGLVHGALPDRHRSGRGAAEHCRGMGPADDDDPGRGNRRHAVVRGPDPPARRRVRRTRRTGSGRSRQPCTGAAAVRPVLDHLRLAARLRDRPRAVHPARGHLPSPDPRRADRGARAAAGHLRGRGRRASGDGCHPALGNRGSVGTGHEPDLTPDGTQRTMGGGADRSAPPPIGMPTRGLQRRGGHASGHRMGADPIDHLDDAEDGRAGGPVLGRRLVGNVTQRHAGPLSYV